MTRGVVLVPLLLAACSTGADKPPAAAPATTTPPPATASATPAVAGTTWPPAGVRMSVEREYTEFRTPSGNIACGLGPENVSCEIGEHTWRLPPKPAGCELDWVAGAQINVATGVAIGLCQSDTVRGATRVLAYGTGVAVGDFACVSEQAGVTCRDGGTGGFFLSRAAVRELPY